MDIEDALPAGAVYRGNVAQIKVPPDADAQGLLGGSENNEERARRPGGSRKTGELEGRLPSQANR